MAHQTRQQWAGSVGRRGATRRQVLRASAVGGAGVSLALLAACGGGDKSTEGTGGTSSAPTQSAGTAAVAEQPKRGGTLHYTMSQPPSLDPDLNTSFAVKGFASLIYGRLLRPRQGPDVKQGEIAMEPDLAEQMEQPDSTTYTFRLRPSVKWQNVAPMNGRAFTSADVRYSFDRFMAKNANKTQFAVVERLDTPDDRTVTFKLKQPFAPFSFFVGTPTHLFMTPRELIEADGDLTKRSIGAGPWILKENTPSSGMKFDRNPDFYDPAKPYIDKLEVAFPRDAATSNAALLSGALDLAFVATGDLKTVQSQIKGGRTVPVLATTLWNMAFDVTRPPFNDQRVRQAISMALDRDELILAARDGQGAKQNMPVSPGLADFWLDPESAEMGPSGKYFKRNLTEAKRLMEAAGFGPNNRLRAPYHFTTYGGGYQIETDLIAEWMPQIYIEPQQVKEEYAAYVSTTFVGKFDGFANAGVTAHEADDYAYIYFEPGNPRQQGNGVNDQQIYKLVQEQRLALEKQQRRKILFEIQRLAAERMWYIPTTIGVSNRVVQPRLKGYYQEPMLNYEQSWTADVWLDG